MRMISLILSVIALISQNKLHAQADTTAISCEFQRATSHFSPPVSVDTDSNDLVISGSHFVLTGDILSQPGKRLQMPVFSNNIDYLKKSRRQKTTGWILLGTGMALVITGIAVAYSVDEDPVGSAVSLVFLSGPGIVTSLISIPFFVASKRSRRRAMAASSSIGFFPKPPGIAGITSNKRYPALTMKMSF